MRFLSYSFFTLSILLLSIQLCKAEIKQDSISDEGNTIQFTLNAGFSDKYLWRGITYNTGLLFQPELVLNYKDFSLSSWSNLKLWDIHGYNKNETDFTLGYYHSFKSFDIESYISYYYYYYAPSDNTAEFNLGFYFSIGDFTLFARSSIDMIANPGGLYGEIGCDYEKELSDKFTLTGTLLTSIGSKAFNEYNLSDFNYTENGKTSLNLASIDLGLSYSPIKDFSIGADFLLNINIDKDVRNAIGGTSNLFEIILKKEF
jgi:hypothetical protein